MIVENIESILYTCVFLLPGYIINLILDKVTPVTKSSEPKYLFSCLYYSVLTFGVFSGVYQILFRFINNSGIMYWVLIVFVSTVGSVCIGYSIAYCRRKKILEKILPSKEINAFNPIPTAWDYCFEKQVGGNVVVTLTDGAIVYGLYSVNSFASSEADERDLFIEKVYKKNNKGELIENKECTGVLISKNVISTIEFFNKEF